METIYGAIIGAVIGSILIIVNEWVKIYTGWQKQKNRVKVWNVLRQEGSTPTALSIEAISEKTKLCAKQLEPLLYEMVQEGTIKEGPFPRTFTRYLRNFSRSPYP
jgi:hypothetical protein